MASSSVYGARFAELYDLFHGGKPYRAEARFVRSAADALLDAKGKTLRLLDLACGTGSHAIELSRMQCEVTGIDSSAGMLAQARRKARGANAKICFEQQDLSRLLLLDSHWDVVTCLFDSLGYLRTDTRIAQALRRSRKGLRPGGTLILEVWHAPAMLAGFDPLRVRRVRGAGIEAVRIGETHLLPGKQMAEVRYEIFSRNKNGPWHRFAERHVNRFFTAPQISDLLESAGFAVTRILGGYDERSLPADDAWHLVALARRD